MQNKQYLTAGINISLCIMKIFSFALLLLAVFFAPTLPAPVRMRTRHERQRRDEPTLGIACAVQNLQEALSHVEIEHDFQAS